MMTEVWSLANLIEGLKCLGILGIWFLFMALIAAGMGGDT